MTKTFYFVGRECEIGGMKFDRFGQVARLDEELIKDAVLGGGAFIPDTEFEALKFDAKELARVQQFPFARVSGAFEEKRETARQAYRDLRAALKKDPHYLSRAAEETVETVAADEHAGAPE